MSRKEAPRLGLVRAVVLGKVTVVEAARALKLSARQVRRLKTRYLEQGVKGLLHGNRGRPSPRRLATEVRRKVLRLLRGRYAGLNDCHLTEKLRELEGLTVSRARVRQLRIEARLPAQRRRRAPRHRRRRERAAQPGAMVLIDGSAHRWLGRHAPPFVLLGAVDDATGAILALVVRPTEDLHGYVQLLEQLATRYGLPTTLYGDRSGILVRNDRHWSTEEELQGRQQPTQFGRMLEELGIGFIPARSPQAKGRIENRWQLLQDRVVHELRLLNVTSPQAVAHHLPDLLADLNRRFAVVPADPRPAWRTAPRQLARILACRYQRQVRHDDTVTLPGRWIQLPARAHSRSRRGRRIELREQLDGTLIALDAGEVIARQPHPSALPFTLLSRDSRARQRQPHLFRPVPILPPRPLATPQPAAHHEPVRHRPTSDHVWRRGYAARHHESTTRAKADRIT